MHFELINLFPQMGTFQLSWGRGCTAVELVKAPFLKMVYLCCCAFCFKPVKKPLEMICQSRWQSASTLEQSEVVVEAYLVQWNCFCDNLPNSRYEEDSSWVAVGGEEMVNKRLAGSCLSVSKGLLFAVLDRHCWLTAELTTYAERF